MVNFPFPFYLIFHSWLITFFSPQTVYLYWIYYHACVYFALRLKSRGILECCYKHNFLQHTHAHTVLSGVVRFKSEIFWEEKATSRVFLFSPSLSWVCQWTTMAFPPRPGCLIHLRLSVNWSVHTRLPYRYGCTRFCMHLWPIYWSSANIKSCKSD